MNLEDVVGGSSMNPILSASFRFGSRPSSGPPKRQPLPFTYKLATNASWTRHADARWSGTLDLGQGCVQSARRSSLENLGR